MGLLNSALQIGRSAILSYQGALQVVGDNISNAANPNHTRLTPGLDAQHGVSLGRDLQSGAGVTLNSIQRNIDEALEGRIRLAIGANESAAAQQGALSRVEVLFDTVSGTDISARLSTFYQAFDNLQNTPEEPATRDLAVSAASQLAESIQFTRNELTGLASDIDAQIAPLVENANDLAGRIGALSAQITAAEAGRGGQATALRDQRDALLRDLSTLFDVTVREEPDGSSNIYIGSEALVQGDRVRRLEAVTTANGSFERTSIRFADTNGEVAIRGGTIGGLFIARDTQALGQVTALDNLASSIISEVNRIHADGQGLNAYSQLTSSGAVLQSDIALNDVASGLAQTPRSGSFFVTVLDNETGTPNSYRIDITLDGSASDTTLDSLVAQINGQVTGLSASITSDNRLALSSDVGRSFVFGFDGQTQREDTSGVLSALGVNTLLTGNDASNIAVSSVIRGNSQLLASASAMAPGDGSTAGRIAGLGDTVVRGGSNLTISDMYNRMAGEVAVVAGAANDAAEVAAVVLESLQIQRESISGVNLDEEAISLVKYQSAFEGSARFVSVVSDLLDELLLLVR